MGAHTCNPSCSRDGEMQVQGQPGQKLARLCLNNKLGMVVHAYNPSYGRGVGNTGLSLVQSKKLETLPET
jgi:hypothetical protein